MGIIIFIYICFYGVLAYLNIGWALLVLLVSLPSYMIRFGVLGVPLTLLEVMIIVIFLVWLISERKIQLLKIKLVFSQNNKLKKVPYPYSTEIILILVVAFISVIVGGLSSGSFGILKAYFIEPIMLYIVIINLVKKDVTLKKIILALGLSAFLLSFFAIVQKFTGLGLPVEWFASGRVTSVYSYPNALGLYLAPIVLLLAGLLFKEFNFRKAGGLQLYEISFLFLTILISLFAMYFARSEGALLGVMIAAMFCGLFLGKRFRWGVLFVSVMMGVGVFFWQASDIRVKEKLLFQDISSTIRLIGWKEAVHALKDEYWLLGAGLSGFQESIRPYHVDGFFFNFDRDPDFRRKIVIFDERYKVKYWQPLEIYMYPHNIILNFWMELGVLGMLLFVWLIGKIVFDGLKVFNSGDLDSERFVVLGVVGGMVVVVVHGMVDVPYFKNDLACLFWVIVALLGVIKLNLKNGESATKIHS